MVGGRIYRKIHSSLGLGGMAVGKMYSCVHSEGCLADSEVAYHEVLPMDLPQMYLPEKPIQVSTDDER